MAKKNIQFIFNPTELGAGTRGASLGPEAIRTAARSKGSSIFSDYRVATVEHQNHLLDRGTNFKFAKYIDGLGLVFNELSKTIEECFKSKCFPIILSGDHSAAAGTFGALKNLYPKNRIGVVWIDAHADLHSPFTTPSGNLHGMPVAAGLGLDHHHLAENNPDTETIAYWNQLKSGIIQPQDLIYVGVRDTETQEDALINELQLRNYTIKELRQRGLALCLQEISNSLAACDYIYISFDVDSIDPIESSMGTGTPVSNGLLFREANDILCFFAKNEKLCALEIVEINPCLDDKQNTMAEQALQLIENVLDNRT